MLLAHLMTETWEWAEHFEQELKAELKGEQVGVALRMEEVKSYLIVQLIGALKGLSGQLDWQGISWIGIGNYKAAS